MSKNIINLKTSNFEAPTPLTISITPLPSKSTNPIYFKHPFPQIQRALIGNIIDEIYTK